MGAAHRSSPTHVLLVEDDPLARRLSARLLRAEFRVTEAECGDEALFALHRERFDVVLTDYRMPAMTGIELLEHTRVHEPHMRRVLMSAGNVPGLAGLCASGIVQAFIRKPLQLARDASVLRGEAGGG